MYKASAKEHIPLTHQQQLVQLIRMKKQNIKLDAGKLNRNYSCKTSPVENHSQCGILKKLSPNMLHVYHQTSQEQTSTKSRQMQQTGVKLHPICDIFTCLLQVEKVLWDKGGLEPALGHMYVTTQSAHLFLHPKIMCRINSVGIYTGGEEQYVCVLSVTP